MKLEILHELNAERAARRPVILVTDTESGEQRLVKAKELRVEEAALTGESLPVEKSIEAVAADAHELDERHVGVDDLLRPRVHRARVPPRRSGEARHGSPRDARLRLGTRER